MPSWWGKSSSKQAKKKTNKESLIDSLQRKFKSPSGGKLNSRSRGSRRRCSDTISEKGAQSRAESRSPSPSKHVSRSQSFAERSHAQPLPLPGLCPAAVSRTDSGINTGMKPRPEKVSKSSLFPPALRPACIRRRPNPDDLDGEMITASISSEGSMDSDDPADLRHHCSQASEYDNGIRTAANSSSRVTPKDQASVVTPVNSKDSEQPPSISLGNHTSPRSPKRRPLGNHMSNVQVPHHSAFSSAPDSSLSSPSRSPIRAFAPEQVMNSAFWAGKTYPDVPMLGSGYGSSPSSGHNSGHNSMGGDMSGQLFWQQSRGSPEYSPILSPRMTSAGPSSRIQSGAGTPVHPKSTGTAMESQSSWHDDGKQQSHRLPLPPITASNSSPFSPLNSAATSPSLPRSPGRTDTTSPGSRWKKGKLLGRGTFGHVYVGFNSGSGEMCAMKEVTLFSDDAKSKESAKQLMQEIALLSRLHHPNIVRYYGSETVDDRLYIYLEYVSGGSIYKILQDYGALGESAIRSFTQQILSGLAYLHSKFTVHRDIKGANILVGPNGRVKLADFGMAKHISGQSCPLSFKGSPYWMAPEVIKNSSGCNLSVDIWSLGCTVLEMATTKPPWSQYEGVAAMFKIGNSKELPSIPDHLSDDGKDFVRQCLQRNPLHRPSAAQLLEHPFVKYAAPLERTVLESESSDPSSGVTGIGEGRNYSALDSEHLASHSSRVSKPNPSDIHVPRNISCPVSPIGSPLLLSRSPQHQSARMSPHISSPCTTSGASTPLTVGSGAIPFAHMKQSSFWQEGIGCVPKSPNGFYVCGPLYNDSNTDVFRGMQPGAHIFSDLVPSENEVLGKQVGRPVHMESYDGQSALADRVSRQLLRDHIKMSPSLDLSPTSPLPSWIGGI